MHHYLLLSLCPFYVLHAPFPSTGITVKGINSLAQTLSFNKVTPNTLTYLNLSDNPLRGEEPQVRNQGEVCVELTRDVEAVSWASRFHDCG